MALTTAERVLAIQFMATALREEFALMDVPKFEDLHELIRRAILAARQHGRESVADFTI